MNAPRSLFLVISLSSLIAAQDAGAKAPPKTGEGADTAPLIAAIESWAKADTAVLTGMSSRQVPEEPPEPASAGGATRVRFGGMMDGGFGEEFKGAFELVRKADGEAVFVSQSSLPGFAHYLKGTKAVNRGNYEARPLDPNRLVNDLFAFVQTADLIEAIKNTKLKAVAVDGGWWFRGELPTKLVRSGQPRSAEWAGVGVFMDGSKVLRIRAELRVNSDGAFAGAKWSVVRSDPAAGFRRRMRDAAESGDGSSGFVLTSRDAVDSRHDEEGPTSTYELIAAGSKPSDRAQTEIDALHALLVK